MGLSKSNFLQQKSFKLAVKIVKLTQYLQSERKEFILSKQICRSGTSIGANIRESLGAVSKADFVNKLSIAYKEAQETVYWLELLIECEMISKTQFEACFVLVDELCRLLCASIKTTRQNMKN